MTVKITLAISHYSDHLILLFQSEFLPNEVCHPYVSNVPQININLDNGTEMTNLSSKKINQN